MAPIPDPTAASPTTTETGLVPAEPGQLSATLLATIGDAIEFKKRRHAEATVAGYARDWAQFERWCRGMGLDAAPATPGVVTLYATHLATSRRRIATIRRHLAAIIVCHRRAGHDLAGELRRSDDFDGVWSGIRRSLPAAPTQKDALEVDTLRAMLHTLPATPGGVRDRALLLTTFVSAARRSEIAEATWGALKRHRRGYEFTIERSKTDQEGNGHIVVLPSGVVDATCPVLALYAWRDLLVSHGQDVGPDTPIFRPVRKGGAIAPRAMSGRAIAGVLQRAALAASLAGVPGAEGLDAQRVAALRSRQVAKRERAAARKAARVERRRLRRRGAHDAAADVIADLPPLPDTLPVSALGGHSLRAGFVTSSVRAGVPLPDIRRQTGHRSAAIERYVRRATLWDQNAASRLGL